MRTIKKQAITVQRRDNSADEYIIDYDEKDHIRISKNRGGEIRFLKSDWEMIRNAIDLMLL